MYRSSLMHRCILVQLLHVQACLYREEKGDGRAERAQNHPTGYGDFPETISVEQRIIDISVHYCFSASSLLSRGEAESAYVPKRLPWKS